MSNVRGLRAAWLWGALLAAVLGGVTNCESGGSTSDMGGGGSSSADLGSGGQNLSGASSGGASSGGASSGGASSGGSSSGGDGPLGGASSGGAASGGSSSGGNGSGGGPPSAEAFITVWNTDPEPVVGWIEGGLFVPLTDETTLVLPLVEEGTYDFSVSWGDGTSSTVTSHDDADAVHEYAEPGEYTVVLEGTIEGWAFESESTSAELATDALKLSRIEQWGSFRFGETEGAFSLGAHLVVTAEDAPDLSAPTTLAQAFAACRLLGTSGNFGAWDVSEVTSTARMFAEATTFDQDLSAWDVSSVTDMSRMFMYAAEFNQALSAWDVSAVTNMSEMFQAASAFNQNLVGWDVSNVTGMSRMFFQATAFNGDVSSWETPSARNMSAMFYSAAAFNQDVSAWDVSSVTNMGSMFNFATAFNQDLSAWDVSSVTNMTTMFAQSGLSSSSYSQLLIGWAAQTTQDNVPLGAGSIQYTAAAQAARGVLTGRGWTITDGGLAP